MAEILILGAGFGGLTAATELAQRAPAHRVTLLDERPTFQMGLGLLQMIDGRRKPSHGERRIADVERHGVRFLQRRATRVRLDERRVETSEGDLAFDHLVVAPGARLDRNGIPGVPEEARNVYTAEGAAAFHEDLARLRGGRVVVLVQSLPVKCPPAPYEAAILAKLYLVSKGVEADVTLVSPEPHPIPIAGPACGATVREWIEERGVVVRNGVAAASVDASTRRILMADGSEIGYDLLAIVPAHRPTVLPGLEGLQGEGGWIPVDGATGATRSPLVHAVGDGTLVKLANGKPLVKAGAMAEGEARAVAQNLAARLRGEPETARFDGKGTCFLEVGHGEAIEVVGDFFASPAPVVAASPPSREGLARKEAFERERLARWFGA